jgi:phosphoserine phosphatase
MLPLNGAAQEFVNEVLRLRPRVAVFDCDGTLWAGDAGAEFLYWELRRGLLPKQVAEWVQPRYREYLDGKVAEDVMCGEMVTIHAGLRAADLWEAGEEFFAEQFAGAVFPEMPAITHGLRDAGCELWAVSSTNEWVVRAGTRRFGIPDDHILAACVHVENGGCTDRLRMVPTDEEKAVLIRATFSAPVDAAFGNSIHDAAMLALAAHPFAVNPNPDLQTLAVTRGWRVYFPAQTSPP